VSALILLDFSDYAFRFSVLVVRSRSRRFSDCRVSWINLDMIRASYNRNAQGANWWLSPDEIDETQPTHASDLGHVDLGTARAYLAAIAFRGTTNSEMAPSLIVLTTLFDKSFLQSLSVDDSVWFDQHFMPVVCPVFYVETLADLAKQPNASCSARFRIYSENDIPPSKALRLISSLVSGFKWTVLYPVSYAPEVILFT
jgi:hypothetical protein